MSNKGMNRRQFLQTSGGAAAGAASTTVLTSGKAVAGGLTTFDEHEAATLLTAARHIFPHESLGDVYYQGVVDALDAEAKDNPDSAKVLKEGVAALDAAKGIAWLQLSAGYQLQVLKGMDTTPFFNKIKGKAVVALYNNKLAWRHFGYEGASADFGGYVQRGFDDLSWLPKPPDSASPKVG